MLTDEELKEILETTKSGAFQLPDDELLFWLRKDVVRLLDYIAELKTQPNPGLQATGAASVAEDQSGESPRA